MMLFWIMTLVSLMASCLFSNNGNTISPLPISTFQKSYFGLTPQLPPYPLEGVWYLQSHMSS